MYGSPAWTLESLLFSGLFIMACDVLIYIYIYIHTHTHSPYTTLFRVKVGLGSLGAKTQFSQLRDLRPSLLDVTPLSTFNPKPRPSDRRSLRNLRANAILSSSKQVIGLCRSATSE